MPEITLVRHGQAKQNATSEEDYDNLSELGRMQAKWVGVWWTWGLNMGVFLDKRVAAGTRPGPHVMYAQQRPDARFFFSACGSC